MNPIARSLLKAALLLAAATLLSPPLQAQRPEPPAGYTVNSTANTSDSYLPDQSCDDGTGRCTLRAAIENANFANYFTQDILFNIPTTDPGYNAQTGSHTIGLSTALPDLADSVNINGPGGTKLILTKSYFNSSFRIFNVTTGGTVNISGITIAAGEPASGENGGGIQNVNSGTVNVTNCILSKNTARSGQSGTIVGGGGESSMPATAP